jgi:hypothetical protein
MCSSNCGCIVSGLAYQSILCWYKYIYFSFLFFRVQYSNGAVGIVSQELYEALTSLQMGKSEDNFDWVVELA